MKQFKQKQFWKATAINTALAILLIITITAYFTAIKYSTAKLETTELLKQNITTPEQLLQHEQEIKQTPAMIKQIYIEWTLETLIFYLLTATIYTALYPNTLSILLNNKLQNFKQFKTALKQNLAIFAIIFLTLAIITLTFRTSIITQAIQITAIISTIALMLTSAAQATKEKTLTQNINCATNAITPFIKKIVFGIIIFTITTALIFNAAIWLQIIKLAAIIPLITIIFATWLSSKTLKAMT